MSAKQKVDIEKITSDEETGAELTLRPQKLADFIGQADLKKQLEIFIRAAKGRGEPLEHILLYGPPGLGKTTLAGLLAKEMGVGIRTTSGPALERAGDLASILTSLEKGDIFFIDEVHRLNKAVEETLYPAMEDFCLDVVLGKGPAARTLRLELNQFTIIAATTKIGLLSSPMRDRFGFVQRLGFYDQTDLEQIVRRSAKIFNIKIDGGGTREIARRSRGTPRITNRILRRVRDFAQVKGGGEITVAIAREALAMLAVDKQGLTETDRQLLRSLAEKYNGGPVGLETLSATINEDAGTVGDVHEPYLLQIGFLKRTPRGRMLTGKAYDFLDLPLPEGLKQEKLI